MPDATPAELVQSALGGVTATATAPPAPDTTTTVEPPEAPPAAPAPVSQGEGRSMADLFAGEVASAGAGSTFYKLGAHANIFRLLPDPNGGAPYVRFRRQRYNNDQDQPVFRTDLTGIVQQEVMLNRALSDEKLSVEDVENIQKYGDPFVVLGDVLAKNGVGYRDLPRNLGTSNRFLWNVVDRINAPGTVAIFESGIQFHRGIFSLLQGEYPDLFDPETGWDVTMQGNGKDGLARRYEGPNTAREPSAIGIDGWQVKLHDLIGSVMRKVVSFDEKVDDLFRVHGELCQQYGVTREHFGQ